MRATQLPVPEGHSQAGQKRTALANARIQQRERTLFSLGFVTLLSENISVQELGL